MPWRLQWAFSLLTKYKQTTTTGSDFKSHVYSDVALQWPKYLHPLSGKFCFILTSDSSHNIWMLGVSFSFREIRLNCIMISKGHLFQELLKPEQTPPSHFLPYILDFSSRLLTLLRHFSHFDNKVVNLIIGEEQAREFFCQRNCQSSVE